MRLKKIFIMMLVVMVVVLLVMLPTSAISAADLSELSDELSTIKKSTLANHTIKFRTPTGVDASTDTITITFPAGFNMGSVAFGDIDLSHGATFGTEEEETLAASASGTAWGVELIQTTPGTDPIVLTLTHPDNLTLVGDIDANDYVIVEIGTNASGGLNQITNPSTARTYQIDIAGTFGDDGEIAVVIVDNDEVAVTGRVLPTLSFSLSANSTSFGNLSASSISTADPDITLNISTNGTDGYTVTVKDAGNGTDAAGLWCAAADNLIASSTATLAAGIEGYGIQASGAGATIDAAYLKTVNDVGALSRTAQILATNNGPADGDTVTITNKAAISNITEAGDYVDTITFNITANF